LRLCNVGFEQDQPVFRPVLLVVVVVVVVVVAVVIAVAVVVLVISVVTPTLLYPSNKIWIPRTNTQLRKMHYQTCISNTHKFSVSPKSCSESHVDVFKQ
jgi:hypothetical protein